MRDVVEDVDHVAQMRRREHQVQQLSLAPVRRSDFDVRTDGRKHATPRHALGRGDGLAVELLVLDRH